jgi:hypothetical protein
MGRMTINQNAALGAPFVFMQQVWKQALAQCLHCPNWVSSHWKRSTPCSTFGDTGIVKTHSVVALIFPSLPENQADGGIFRAFR